MIFRTGKTEDDRHLRKVRKYCADFYYPVRWWNHNKLFATNFDGVLDKENFNYIMRKLCTDSKAISSVFTTEGWTSKIAEKENKNGHQNVKTKK